jgi:hypothetical protein
MSDLSLTPSEQRYVALKAVGAGGMANIVLARDSVLGRKVVLKEIRPELAGDAELSKMFLDEARLIASLNHPNIVRIYDVGRRHGLPFMALEWLEGWDLRTIEDELTARKRFLDLKVALRLMADAARGLHAAHTARNDDGQPLRLVHRDVSPHNLFVTTEGSLKLLDFGIAKSSVQSKVTAANMIKGKFAYMSPEQLDGFPIDARTDIFALGINLHELLSGKSLFGRHNPVDARDAIVAGRIHPPVRPSESLPPDVVAVAMHALERDPSMRFQTACEMADAVDAVMQEHGWGIAPSEIAGVMGQLFAGSGPVPRERRPTVALGFLDEGGPVLTGEVFDLTPRTETIGTGLVDQPADPRGARRSLSRWLSYALALLLGALVLALAGGLLFLAMRSIPAPPAAVGLEPPAVKAPMQVVPPASPVPRAVDRPRAPPSREAGRRHGRRRR